MKLHQLIKLTILIVTGEIVHVSGVNSSAISLENHDLRNDTSSNNFSSSAFQSRTSVTDSLNDSTSTFVINNLMNANYDNQYNNDSRLLNEFNNRQTKFSNDQQIHKTLAPTTTTNSAYPQNHQIHYPSEPYLSNSKTSPSISSSNVNTKQQHSSIPSNHQLLPLLTRDHHQSSTIGYPQHQSPDQSNNNFNSDSSSFNYSNTLGNQGYQGNSFLFESPSFGSTVSSSSSSLNTGLIQNLTSGLFPIKQLSNATLFTLSELLNKTKQAVGSSQSPSRLPYFNNNGQFQTKPFNFQSGSYNNYVSPSLQNPSTSNSNNFYDTATLSDQSSLLDQYIRPSQFGFREPQKYQQQQQHQSAYRPPLITRNAYGNQAFGNNYDNSNQYNSNVGYKTASNIYNTYTMPNYKDSMNKMPSMTNGQTLAMAIYDNLIDNAYRIPNAASSNYKSYGPSMDHTRQFKNSDQYNNNNLYNPNQQQFIQQSNLYDQNQLDKIVYHSTPFRPSIISPPTTTMATADNNQQGSTSTTPSSLITTTPTSIEETGSNKQQRPKTEADNKSVSFASLGSSSSSISDSKSEHATNGQTLNSNRYPSSRHKAHEKSNNSNNSVSDEMDDSDKSLSGNNNNSTARGAWNSNSNDFDKQNYGGNSSSSKSANNSFLNSGPSLLFDLYEREIDNQIREALYGDATRHSDHLLSDLAGRPESQWPMTSDSSLYDDTVADSSLSPWRRPITSHHQHSSSSLLPSLSASKLRPSTTLAAPPISIPQDPLSAALSELPTFSASDLQPIFPTGPAYSLLPTATTQLNQHDSAAAGSTLTSLASHLFPLSYDTNDYNFAAQNSKLNAQSSQTNQPTTSSYLPTILFKLNSSPLSSILANPLTHLYASLPTTKHKDKSTKHNNLLTQHQSQASSQHNQYMPLLSHQLSAKNILSAFNGGLPVSSSHHKVPSSQLDQSQQAALAAATANLIAAATAASVSENSLSPLQTALLQSQAANILSPAAYVHLSQAFKNQQPVPASTSTSTTVAARPTGTFGLAGGGISPLIWKSILSPTLAWTRKLNSQQSTSSGQTSSTSAASSPMISTLIPLQLGSHLKSTTTQQNNSHSNKLHLNPLSSLFGGHSLTSYLFNPMSSATTPSGSSVPTSSSEAANNGQKKPKLKIKILKIPLAYYDQPTGSGAGASGTWSASQLLPAQMQPNQLAAMLLNSMPCPLTHTTITVPHSLEQHLTMFDDQQHQLVSGNLASLSSTSSSSSPTSPSTSSSSLIMNNSAESPLSIQGFTDINQPNDLQVSPASLQGKLLKLLK